MKFNFYNGATISAWLLAVLVIVAELVAPFKDALKNVFTHHWIGKVVLVFIAFFVFAFLFKDKKSLFGMSDEKAAWYSTLGSLAIILLFYVYEFVV
ncbi:hypothetical protein J4450_08535 [Candidatus Micrarchaeota archaeon]|nr:hypothetical protein [Candidatus Micrarchaeota archaeon]